MREIKFRAWHKKRKKFYEVLHLHIKTLMNGGIWATCSGKDCIEQKDIQIQIQPEDCTIEQYTGLKDSNGIEIYEGDILAHELYGTKKAYSDCLFVMSWNEERAAWTDYSPRDKFYVIGNRHENPELLEG